MKLQQTSQWNVLSGKIKPGARPLISELSESHPECYALIFSYLDYSNGCHWTDKDSGSRDDTSSNGRAGVPGQL